EPPRPRQHNAAVPHDLETIVLKAMTKEAEGRYATARELADDLRRFLACETIRARRPTWRQHVAKFARRHQGWVLASAIVLLAVAVLSVGSALLLWTAWESERKAREDAQQEAERKEEQRQKARASAGKMLRSYDDMYVRVVEQWF